MHDSQQRHAGVGTDEDATTDSETTGDESTRGESTGGDPTTNGRYPTAHARTRGDADGERSGRCRYTFDPTERTDASLRTTWECPHPAHRESNVCVFHLSADERAALDVSPKDVVDRLFENLHADDPRMNEYVGASLPNLPLTYQRVDGETNHVLNFQHAEIEGIDLTHGHLAHGLNVREATLGRVTFEDATVTGDVEAEGAVVTDALDTSEATFEQDVHFDGATFEGPVVCDETTFEEDTTFEDATFRETVAFRNATTSGSSHVLADHISFAGANFRDEAHFRQTDFQYVTFADATFESRADFEHTNFEGDTVFDDCVFADVADFDEARFSHDAGFTGARFEALAEFRGVEFDGGSRTASDDVTFEDAVFEGEADFKLARFRFADFKSARCRGELNLDRATFHARAECRELVVEGETNLHRATFAAPAVFADARFEGDVGGVEATFESDVTFGESVFAAAVTFDDARFLDDTAFESVTFEADARFRGTAFEGGANYREQNCSFDETTFEGDADFDGARFTNGSFWDTTFEGVCSFRGAVFEESATFRVRSGLRPTYVDLTDATVESGNIVESGGSVVPYDMTKTTLGDVRLEGERAEGDLLDHFRFCLTDFDGFDFSNHHAYLERNDWTIHDFDENEATGNYAVEATNETIEETYRKAQASANDVGDTPASREFEFKRYYYNRKKNADILLNEYSLNAWSRVKKSASVGLNLFMQVTCGYGNRLPRIAAWTFLLPAVFGIFYVLGGPLETQAGVVWNSADPAGTLFDGLYYSYISFSTVGYGDINPLGWMARLFAMSQGMLNGLFFTLLTFTLFKRVLGGS
ncbi:pentapeptide repeat-containing protein [Halogeometricum limi]|uniref:Pentapeptide repeat-containing protein n=1 Tax=Halogeometricum limi TaxID=555875 RepID=A0A1I6ILT9_9EURY|nr:pentapeptide repeat-containing protein [Halogeometricum limi]SFR67737.1 Pentapeptide repeat-containing protein [Halogeometricum limi]